MVVGCHGPPPMTGIVAVPSIRGKATSFMLTTVRHHSSYDVHRNRHLLLTQPPTEATRPMSSVYDTIGPEKVVDGRFHAETRVAHTLDKGGWDVDQTTGKNNLPPSKDHYVTSTGATHFHQIGAINSKSPETIGRHNSELL